ncbi:unnamed protein product [Clavelina lepadiformis]|uniref:CWH43-like N-terminal domain-containing protein n=1 Tax=Clavelina lepadiformis TaxID=159417 RepID=A0ABP0FQ26_CLALP
MKKVWVLPLFIFFLLGGGIIICYVLAVELGHVQKPPYWPTVSQTGVNTPERGWFTMFLMWGSFLSLTSIYFYHKHAEEVIEQTRDEDTDTQCTKLKRCNIAALVVGSIGCFGISMVGAFQTGTPNATKDTHYAGAFIAFISLLTYSWLITYISYHSQRDRGDRFWICVRLALAILGAITFIIFSVGYGLTKLQTGSKYNNLASIAEWCQIYLAILFLTTLFGDLRKIHKINVKVNIRCDAQNRGVENPSYSENANASN